ncbi:MAG: hypothetical protein H0Z37_07530 [Firmicutes bacterium]|nr:hypothetical protein [Bacillota bacterium]
MRVVEDQRAMNVVPRSGSHEGWIAYWRDFIDSLSEDGRRKLLTDMGLAVPGFRRGAKIPDKKVRSTLEAEPGQHNGKRFMKWFRKRFSSLVLVLENDSGDAVEKKLPSLVEDTPPAIVRMALAMFRPELFPSLESTLNEHEERLRAKATDTALHDLSRQVSELKEELEELRRQLDAARRENGILTGENRKLQRQNHELQKRLDKVQVDAEQKIGQWKEKFDKLQQLVWNKEKEIHLCKTKLEQVLLDINNRDKAINELQRRINGYKRALAERQHLTRLYGSMAKRRDPGDAPPDMQVLVLGAGFPTEAFEVNGKLVHIEGIEVPGEVDRELIQRCAAYNRVFLLSSCPYAFRLSVYGQLGGVTEIPSLAQVRNELGLEE